MSNCCTGGEARKKSSFSCQCEGQKATSLQQHHETREINKIRYIVIGIVALAVWWVVYSGIVPLSQWIAYDLFPLEKGSPLGDSVEFFFYDTAKILLLLVLMVYAIAWLRAGMHVERVRNYLMGKGRGVGYFLGAGFGAITPFCSCSSIPLFLGFTTARIPLGITMSFLITSPLINEIAVVLLWGLLGWKFTIIYVVVGMVAGIIGGVFMDAIRAERWLQPFLLEAMKNAPLGYGHTTGASTQNRAYGTPYFCLLRDKQHFPPRLAMGDRRCRPRSIIARFCTAGVVYGKLGSWSVVVCSSGCCRGHSAVYQCHGYYSGYGKPTAQGVAPGNDSGLLHEHCGREPAGSAHAQAGHELEAAGGISWHVIDYIYACRLVI